MKKTMLASLLLLVGFYTIAQSKLLTIEDALVNNRSSLAVKNLRGAQFLYGTEDLVYLDNQDGKDLWVKKGAIPFLSLEDLNGKLKAAGLEELKTMPLIQFNKSADWVMTVGGNRIALNPGTG
jgi:dipeptidyl-peptidase 4